MTFDINAFADTEESVGECMLKHSAVQHGHSDTYQFYNGSVCRLFEECLAVGVVFAPQSGVASGGWRMHDLRAHGKT